MLYFDFKFSVFLNFADFAAVDIRSGGSVSISFVPTEDLGGLGQIEALANEIVV